MKVLIRADASVQIGSGHIMRCLTLAGELEKEGAEVSFVCRDLPGNLCRIVEKKGYEVGRLPIETTLTEQSGWKSDAEMTQALVEEKGCVHWLVVDHYGLDCRWESMLRPHVRKIMVIDDLANRGHHCDLLLDQNLYKNMEGRYKGLVPEHARMLLGPRYALLRPEFKEARKKLRQRDGRVRRILVFFGGSDATNETTKTLEALKQMNLQEIVIDVVVGRTNPHKDRIKEICSRMPWVVYHCQIENMAELMAGADLAIGAGGTATWERCYLGLPAITVVVAQNQFETTTVVNDAGALHFIGWFHQVGVEEIKQTVAKFLASPKTLKEMSQKAMKLFHDSHVERDYSSVVKVMMEFVHA